MTQFFLLGPLNDFFSLPSCPSSKFPAFSLLFKTLSSDFCILTQYSSLSCSWVRILWYFPFHFGDNICSCSNHLNTDCSLLAQPSLVTFTCYRLSLGQVASQPKKLFFQAFIEREHKVVVKSTNSATQLGLKSKLLLSRCVALSKLLNFCASYSSTVK